MTERHIIKKATTIIKQFDVEKIILFGSRANGSSTAESDIDLLVIKDLQREEVRNFRIKLKKALYEGLGEFNHEFDIIVDNEERIRNRIALGDLFYKEIYSQGKILYA
ncbi:MAG: nucleotidyltransferase domain-containing protein [Bacteroidales bacterium]|nr:nucleotidyltransferase domain-containing protein [Bacteroidales bacterium]